MKLQRVWLPLLIVVLIAASLFVVFGTRYDAKTHSRTDRFPVHYGLDIKGGVRAVLEINAPPSAYENKMPQIIDTIERRINSAGVSEPVVQQKGKNQIVVELPAVQDKNAILQRLGTTAQLEFRHFKDVQTDRNVPGARNRPITMTTVPGSSPEQYQFNDLRSHKTFRDGRAIYNDFRSTVLSQPITERPNATLFDASAFKTFIGEDQVYLTPDQIAPAKKLVDEMSSWNSFIDAQPLILKGDEILPNSRAELGQGAQPAVSQNFNPQGSKSMEEFTSHHINDWEGIILDGQVLSVPYISSTISDQGQISGGFATLAKAKELADLLNAGALPVPLKQVQTQSVDAPLGLGAVRVMEIAGGIGLVLVMVFMLILYRLPGLVADIALVIYTLFTMAIFRGGLEWLGIPAVTLTLAGMAGFVLSIGMAVDANILIFERMKEEMRNGRSLRPAIDAGFRRAFPAIRDSNICTIITCIVLLSMGSASVRGFALTLMLGVIVSLFSAITVTRTLLYSLVNAGLGKNTAIFGVPAASVGKPDATKTGFNIVGKRKLFYALSVLIIIPGMIAWGMGGLKRSIEFSGGSQIEVKFPKVMTQSAIHDALVQDKIPDPLVQMAEGGTYAIISTPEQTNETDKFNGINLAQTHLEHALKPLGDFTRINFDNVLPTISKEFVSNAFQAVCLASVLIIIYLALVFGIGGFVAGLRLGTSAIVALLHDVLVLIGVFAILGYLLNWKIDSLFVTATLTVIGFSVHDTVVIFDRVRENLRHRSKGETFEGLVNHSILQTFRRSVATSLTVLMTLLSLILFGVHDTLLLNVALFIGILSGTYSSIFNAASILVDWENWLAKRRGSDRALTAPATASAGANGSAPRPAAVEQTRPRVTVPSGGDDDESASRVKPKRKRPVRRF